MKEKYIPLQEFVDEGYLQEVNRRFFHPLGIALEFIREDNGELTISGFIDQRDDPEGYYFVDPVSRLIPKKEHIDELWSKKEPIRMNNLGYVIQPVDSK